MAHYGINVIAAAAALPPAGGHRYVLRPGGGATLNPKLCPLQVGTALYCAPEVVQNTGAGSYDGAAADVWACGIILFIMVFGKHPFERPTDKALPEPQQMFELIQRVLQVCVWGGAEPQQVFDLIQRVLLCGGGGGLSRSRCLSSSSTCYRCVCVWWNVGRG